MTDHGDKAPLGEVGGLGARERVEHAPHQREHVHVDREHADQQADPKAPVRLPEIVHVEHDAEPDHAHGEL